ncbi:MAG: class I SAM-dependent methyltransferase [Ignavibacteria bacterium]
MKKLIGNFLGKLNIEPHKKSSGEAKAEGYPDYLRAANELGLDVNDYLDNNLGWIKPGQVLEEVLYPVMTNLQSPKILELGPGTGRWTRQILKRAKQINSTEFSLADHSQWMIDFLRSYFNNEKIIKAYKNNGISLPFKQNEYDLIFSQGVFIELKPSFIYLYSKEFARVLKPGGYCVFDYFNFDSNDGWEYFIKESDKGNIYYTFYSDEFIDRLFKLAGFILEKRFTYGKAKFVVMKKDI